MTKSPSPFAAVFEAIEAMKMRADLHENNLEELENISQLRKDIEGIDLGRRALCGKRDKSLKPDEPPLSEAIEYLDDKDRHDGYYLNADADYYSHWREQHGYKAEREASGKKEYSIETLEKHLKKAAEFSKKTPRWARKPL